MKAKKLFSAEVFSFAWFLRLWDRSVKTRGRAILCKITKQHNASFNRVFYDKGMRIELKAYSIEKWLEFRKWKQFLSATLR